MNALRCCSVVKPFCCSAVAVAIVFLFLLLLLLLVFAALRCCCWLQHRKMVPWHEAVTRSRLQLRVNRRRNERYRLSLAL